MFHSPINVMEIKSVVAMGVHMKSAKTASVNNSKFKKKIANESESIVDYRQQ